MTQNIILTIILEVPDGTNIITGQPSAPRVVPAGPLPSSAVADDSPFPPLAAVSNDTTPQCPEHGPMKRYPAGTNKAGKPYNASWRCAKFGCPTKAIWDKDAA